ncbi:hypothetical protein DH2020_008478 [Rehmannia glutinosa]|uniref:Reverse transcriptase domain-containing protein n=1 Tax=Rehmannia glutinosa TaxID=99300 RepID=A0ABR0X766_REHGL
MWALHPDFIHTVQGAWNLNFWGKAQFILCKKLKALKPTLKELNKSHFSHISSRVKQVKTALKNSQIQLHVDPLNSALNDIVKELKAKETFLAKAERSFLSQKAKCDFLNNSDRNTKFFHSIVKRNSLRKQMNSVILEDGSKTSSFDELSIAFVNYFKNLFGTSFQNQIDGPSHSSTGLALMRMILVRFLTRSPQAIKLALFDIEDDRSPVDGFFLRLFQKILGYYWQRCSGGCVCEFLTPQNYLDKSTTLCYALIPKTIMPLVADFRPIACCNVVYKVITKILASKLESVVPKLIDPAQSAFISVLNGLGFPPIFISWVMECVSSASYSICINGSLQGKFPGKRGLRQGDPMSPALFLLCMEYLSRLLNVRTKTLKFKYHPRCEALRITHLAFADDLMLFSRGDLPSVKILIECLNDFKNASGLDVNSFKSNLFTAGIIGDELDNILNLLNFPLGSLPVRYLGVPLAAQRLNVNHYAPLYDRIASYINKWMQIPFLIFGRLILIKSSVARSGMFLAPNISSPKHFIVVRLIDFASLSLGKNTSPIAWSKVCFPYEEGGLGIRDVNSWNKALLAKILGIFIQKSTPLGWMGPLLLLKNQSSGLGTLKI